jgi:CII-binding regulator of phage lambda lysogenization HflD
MAKVEDLANEIVLAKEQLMNINNTINRDRGVLEDLKKEIKQTEELKKLAEDKLEELTDQVTSIYANKDAAEKEY